MKKMEKSSYKPGNSNSKTNNPEIRAEAARRFEEAKKEAASKLAAPAPTSTGKGFKKLNNDTGRGFELNKSSEEEMSTSLFSDKKSPKDDFKFASLPYGARMLIERYDNEKKLRKN